MKKIKIPFCQQKLRKKTQTLYSTKKKFKKIKTWSRASTILPSFVGFTFQVHNGQTFSNIEITNEIIGRKLGEFVITRKQIKNKKWDKK